MIRENILIGSDRFFNIRSFQSKYFTMPRHLHAEYELVWIDRGFGKKSIGEVIKPFTDGDLTLIGPDCPHLFIADDAYYADAVAWAVEEGIAKGTGDGAFSPNAACTRAQIVTFLYRATQK